MLGLLCCLVIFIASVKGAEVEQSPTPVEVLSKCGIFEVYKTCGTNCPLTCENYKNPPRTCTEVCKEGCFCINGYVRDDERCIPPENCVPRCGYNETFRTNYLNAKTCDYVTLQMTEPGCYCKDAYVLNRLTGRCIFEHECPRIECNMQHFCPENEVLDRCKNPCERTCMEPHPPVCNYFACNDGCVCKSPLIRNPASGRCIEEKYCPVSCLDHNAVKADCAPRCPLTCQNPFPQSCNKECAPGCVCRNGFIKDEYSGKCVLPKFCPAPLFST